MVAVPEKEAQRRGRKVCAKGWVWKHALPDCWLPLAQLPAKYPLSAHVAIYADIHANHLFPMDHDRATFMGPLLWRNTNLTINGPCVAQYIGCYFEIKLVQGRARR